MTQSAKKNRRSVRWASLAIAGLVAATAIACRPEVEPNDTNAEASDNNQFAYNKNASQGASFVFDGTVTRNADDNDIWFHYTTQSSNDLTVKIQGQACIVAEVKKCNAQAEWWAECSSQNRVDVGLIWNCPILGSTNPEVDLTIGLNKLIRVEVAAWPSGPAASDYTYSMHPN